MRTLSRPTLSVLALALLAACEPPESEGKPILVEPIALRSGAWTLEVVDATMAGPCEGMDLREIVGSQLEAGLRLRSGGRAVVQLDGVRMTGDYVGNHLEVTGALYLGDPGEPEMEPHPDEEEVDHDDEGTDTGGEDAEEGGGDGASHPSPGPADDAPEAPEPGAQVYLSASALGPARLEGTLTVDYDLPGLRCVVDADVEGRFGEDGERPDEPVVVGTETGCDEDVDCG